MSSNYSYLNNSIVNAKGLLNDSIHNLNNLLTNFDNYIDCKNLSENVINNAATEEEEEYDYNGAIVYIIFITLFYSISVLAIIRIQTKKRTDFYEYDDEDEYSGYKPESVLRGMKNENVTKQVLEDLRDPELRAKLWDIYQKDNVKSPKTAQIEQKKIQMISKKLKQYYKDSPEYYNKTVDNSAFGGRESRPSIPIFRQNSTKLDDTHIRRDRINASHSESSGTNKKQGRFEITNVNEKK